jgi:hypothetical protein
LPYCNYTLPGGQGIFGNEDISLVETNVAEMQINNTAASEDTYFGKGLRSHLSSTTIIRAQWNGSIPENVNATECGLDICVRKYKGSMQRSVFSEEVIDTFIDTTQTGGSTGNGALPVNFTVKVPQSWNNDKDGKDSDVFTVTWEAHTGLTLIFKGQTAPLMEGKYLSTNLGDTDVANLIRPLDNAGVEDLMERYVCYRLRHSVFNPNMNGIGLQKVCLWRCDRPRVAIAPI